MQRFSGTDYLKIDIASNYGLDKETWEKRLAWFSLHEHCLMEMLATSDKPALYYAGVQAWFATQRGEPTGYPISLDATASGMQLLACLTGDRSAARLCNVVSQAHGKMPMHLSMPTCSIRQVVQARSTVKTVRERS